MGRIQSNIGLISGLDIGTTVDKLMQLAARPRDLLQTQTDAAKQRQVAVTQLSALLLAVQYVAQNLGKAGLFDQRQVASSDPSAVTATVTGSPAKGSYQLTPLRMVQSHQLLSSNFKSLSDPLGGGSVTFRFGSNLERAAPLDLLGDGAGFSPGSIRITDRSGQRADIDLSTARTLDDVLEAMNGNTAINVTAVAQGDHLRLVDNTGQSLANLKVQEVGSGRTAASLGLDGIDAAASTADGRDLLGLYAEMDLDALSDGRGIRTSTALPEISFRLHDGTVGSIDFSPIQPGGSQVDKETTLGDILERFNAAAPGKLQLQIAPDGKRLVATDLTSGENAFELLPMYEFGTLADLGLDHAAEDGTIVGRRLLGGLQTVLLGSLDGGQGLGGLGGLSLTDRSGASATVDLSAAETVDDVLAAINTAGLGIEARVNAARNGIELRDTTGVTSGHLVVANADETNTAERLKIAVDADVTAVNSGDLHLQVVSLSTKLADLNGGAGVARGTFVLGDSTGRQAAVDLRDPQIQTVGDVIAAIQRQPLQLRAEINPTGDGIRIVDTARGTATLRVSEGSTTTAHDLHLDRPAGSVTVGGEPTQVIDGTTTYTIQLGESDSLADLREKINQLGAGVSATVLSDGSSRPYRLAVASQRPGKAGELVFDTSGAGFSLAEAVPARDALVLFGQPGAAGILVSSPTNRFDELVPGLSIQLQQASGRPVTLTVSTTDTSLVASVKTLVDNYNKFRAKLTELTAYDAESNKRSILTGDAAALRLDTDLAGLLSGRFASTGGIQSLAEVGVTFQQDGTLSFDEARLKAAYAADPDAVTKFFSADKVGLSEQLNTMLDQLANEDQSLLASRFNALKDKIARNEERLSAMDNQLQVQRLRLYLQFYRMELAIAKLQSNLNYLDAIQPIDTLTNPNNNTSW